MNMPRSHEGDTIFGTHTLYRAAQSQADTEIDDVPARFRRLTRHAGDRQELVRWLWTILLADGTRALASAGRWSEAASQARQHNGIGQRLLDGRQILILAHCHNHDYATARATLASAATPTRWEKATAACLEGMRRTWSSEPCAGDCAGTISKYLPGANTDEPALFRIRLALTALSLPGQILPTTPTEIAWLVAHEALDSHDAYAAYDAVTCPGFLAHTEPGTIQKLREVAREAGLQAGSLPAELMEDLMMAVGDSEAAISDFLQRGSCLS